MDEELEERRRLASRCFGCGSSNPMAGYVFRCQDQYDDSGVGGVDGDVFPMTLSNTAVETAVCVILVNDFGVGNATTEPQ